MQHPLPIGEAQTCVWMEWLSCMGAPWWLWLLHITSLWSLDYSYWSPKGLRAQLMQVRHRNYFGAAHGTEKLLFPWELPKATITAVCNFSLTVLGVVMLYHAGVLFLVGLRRLYFFHSSFRELILTLNKSACFYFVFHRFSWFVILSTLFSFPSDFQ